MKPTTCSRSFKTTALMAAISLVAICPKASAAPYYWGQTTVVSGTYNGTFATTANWYTDVAGTTGATESPNAADADVIFSTTPAIALSGTVIVGANITANSLTFNTTGSTTLAQSGNQNLILGSGGINLGASSGPVTIGTGNFLNTRLSATQGWANNSASLLTVRSLTTNNGAGAVTLTLNAAGAGGILFSTNIGEDSGDPLAIVIDSSGAGLTTFNGSANTYTGGTTIKRGELRANGTLGSGSVLLGDTAGSASATLHVRPTSGSFANDITVRNGSSGNKTIVTNQSGGVVLGGALILNDNLALNTATDGTFNGPISGSGDVVKTGNAALIFGGANTSSGDLTINAGAFTLAEAGSLTFTIGANGVNNQLNGVSSGAVSLDGTFNFNLTGASLVDGNSWTIVSLGSTTETYGGTFAITGFTETANVWTNGSGFTFTESTGVLSYAVPEPTTCVFLLGGALGVFAFGNRRRNRASC